MKNKSIHIIKGVAFLLIALLLISCNPIHGYAAKINEENDSGNNIDAVSNNSISEDYNPFEHLTYIESDKEKNGIENKVITNSSVYNSEKVTSYPVKYRSDKVDTDGDGNVDKCYLPAMRNQYPFGTCWAFAALGACEANLIRKGLATTSIDLSESHLAYYFYNKLETLADPKGNEIGDYNRAISNNWPNAGGNVETAGNFLMSGCGLVEENKNSIYQYATLVNNQYYDYTYGNYSSTLTMPQTTQSLYGSNSYKVMSVQPINTSDRDAMKDAIMNYGSVAVAYYAANSSQYDSMLYGKNTADEGNYYVNIDAGVNHGVQIVGWDDNYSASKFVINPGMNGAWLVKNSWGAESSYLSQNGYFWLSYADATLSEVGYVFDCEKVTSQENIYQYDGGVLEHSIYGYKFANVYTVQENGVMDTVAIDMYDDYKEYDLEIYFYYNEIDVNENTLDQGILISKQSGITNGRGWQRIELKDDLIVRKGETYAIVFNFHNLALIESDYGYANYFCNTDNEKSYRNNGYNWSNLSTNGYTAKIKLYTTNAKVTENITEKYSDYYFVYNSPYQNEYDLVYSAVRKDNNVEVISKIERKLQSIASSDDTIATVDYDPNSTSPAYTLYIHKPGQANVIVRNRNVYSYYKINAYRLVNTISLETTGLIDDELPLNQEAELNVVFQPETPESPDVKWEISGDSIEIVPDENDPTKAKIVAKKEGSTLISVFYTYPVKTCPTYKTITVITIPIKKVIIQNKRKIAYVSDEGSFDTIVEPKNTTDDKKISWESSNTDVVTIDENGNWIAVGEGTTTITAIATYRNEVKDSFEMRVKKEEEKPKKISIQNKKQDVYVQESGKYNLDIEPINIVESAQFLWESSDESVITIDNEGNWNALREGSALITVAFEECPEVKDTVKMNVKAKEVIPDSKDNNSKKTEKNKSILFGTKFILNNNTYTIISSGEVELSKASLKQKNVSIPNKVWYNGKGYSVTKIGDKAFKNAKITKFIFPNTVTEIGDSAFENCKNLKKIVINKNISKIGKKAFYKCKSLKLIDVRSKLLKKVGKMAFKKIASDAKIKTPKKKKKEYTKLLNKKCDASTVVE